MPRGMPADLDARVREAFRLFRADLARYETEVLRAVKVPLKPHEFDALVSFHYNTGGIAKAALTRHLNDGNRVAAADAFLNWRRPASIIPRREAEQDLFCHGRYPAGTIPVWSVDRTGRVDFSRPIRRLTEGEALALLRRPPTPRPPVVNPEPDTPTGWLARLAAFFSTLIRRA
jgi:lysozyme